MTRDDIIRMAREAHLVMYDYDHPSLERFAKLLRNDYSTKHAQLWLKRIDEAVAAEREACAKVCDELETCSDAEFYGHEFSAAIRARGQA